MDTPSTQYRVHQCSYCQEDTEYYCKSCLCDLCPQCKENHVKDLQTIDHSVLSYGEKINHISKQEICVRHPNKIYHKYCVLCELPVCNNCGKHRKHKKMIVKTAYKTKKQQHGTTIHTIRCEVPIYKLLLLPKIKADFKTCHKRFSLYRSKMLTKAQNLKGLIYKVKKYFMRNVLCDFDFKHR